MTKIVSACLAGINCKYNGGSNPCEKVIELVKQGKAIPVCPEQLGGLTTPREVAEKKADKVVTKSGQDVTSQFKKGAEEALAIAKLIKCNEAVLKSKSPSCGFGKIYDGTFTGRMIEGNGIFAEILKKNNVKIITEDDL